MDENHRDKVESELEATEIKLWHPPLSIQDQKKLDHFQKKKLPKWTGFADRTLWEWLQLLGLLAIPLVVTGATLFFGIQQANLANQQHEADQLRALDQQQAAILQTYIDNIQDLLLHDNLRGSKLSDDVEILARARTLTALQGLDPGRKGHLVQFLYEAQLIGFQGDKVTKYKLHNKIIDLSLADLSNTNLSGDIFNNAHLPGADFTGANFSFANLTQANLTRAIFYGASLWGAQLGGTNLSDANLSDAHLIGTHLSDANLSDANLTRADLFGAGLIGTHLSGANLSGANLFDTGLLYADLRDVNFRNAEFSDANLSFANLSGATFLTQHQLDQVSSCKGAILPRGLTCHRS